MNKKIISAVLAWLRRADSSSLSEITPYELFVAAFPFYEEVTAGSRKRIEHDLQDFDTRGLIPNYVARFLREVIFPIFLRHSTAQPKGDMSCESAEH